MRALLGRLHLIYLAFAFIVVWIAIAAVGIRDPGPASGYYSYTLTEGPGHLYFEHAARVPVKTVSFTEDKNYVMVDLYGRYAPEHHTRTRMWITVTRNPSGEAPNPGLFLDSALGVAETLPGFRYIDYSSLTVDGVQAEQIVYSNTTYRSDYETKILHLEPFTVVTRQIFLAHGEAIWSFAITASETIADTEMAEFEHLLATFKFLD